MGGGGLWNVSGFSDLLTTKKTPRELPSALLPLLTAASFPLQVPIMLDTSQEGS